MVSTHPRRWSEGEQVELQRLAASGHSCKEIANRLGRSVKAIRRRKTAMRVLTAPWAVHSLEERFWLNIQKIPDGCWVWTGSKTTAGYGTMGIGGKTSYMHRYSYEMHNGVVSPGLEIRHQCHNPACVNPKHLLLGTSLDNARDMVEAGRSLKGERHPMSKLTTAAVIEIKNAFKTGAFSQRQLAELYKVDPSVISNIKTGRLWSHVEDR